jgi:hypothetical protein
MAAELNGGRKLIRFGGDGDRDGTVVDKRRDRAELVACGVGVVRHQDGDDGSTWQQVSKPHCQGEWCRTPVVQAIRAAYDHQIQAPGEFDDRAGEPSLGQVDTGGDHQDSDAGAIERYAAIRFAPD